MKIKTIVTTGIKVALKALDLKCTQAGYVIDDMQGNRISYYNETATIESATEFCETLQNKINIGFTASFQKIALLKKYDEHRDFSYKFLNVTPAEFDKKFLDELLEQAPKLKVRPAFMKNGVEIVITYYTPEFTIITKKMLKGRLQ